MSKIQASTADNPYGNTVSSLLFKLEGPSSVDIGILIGILKEFSQLTSAIVERNPLADPNGIHLEVSALHEGSFEITFEFISQVLTNAANIVAIISGVFALKKWLMNRKASKVEPSPNNPQQVRITVDEGTYIDVPPGVTVLISSKNVDLHVANISGIARRHSRDSAGFSISHDGKTDYYTAENIKEMSLRSPHFDQDQSDRVYYTRALLAIKSPVLIGKAKWQFKHGSTTLAASITDEIWLASFRNRQCSLSAGDSIDALLQITVPVDENGVHQTDNTQYSIVKVYGICYSDASNQAKQTSLFPMNKESSE